MFFLSGAVAGRETKPSNAPVSKPLCLIRLFSGIAHEAVGSLSDYPSTCEVVSLSALLSLCFVFPFVGEPCANGSRMAIEEGWERQWILIVAHP